MATSFDADVGFMLIGDPSEITIQPHSEPLQTETESLQSKTESLQTETESLQTETESLQTETDALQIETKSFQSETESLQIETKSLQSETDALQIETKSFQSETESLQSEPSFNTEISVDHCVSPLNKKDAFTQTEHFQSETEPVKDFLTHSDFIEKVDDPFDRGETTSMLPSSTEQVVIDNSSNINDDLQSPHVSLDEFQSNSPHESPSEDTSNENTTLEIMIYNTQLSVFYVLFKPIKKTNYCIFGCLCGLVGFLGGILSSQLILT